MSAVALIPRHLSDVVRQRLTDEPAVLLGGPRAVGKTTLVTEIARDHDVEVLDLSVQSARLAAEQDPDAFLTDRRKPIVIDEYQLVPSLLPVIKRDIDRHQETGGYLITGSTTGALLPRGTESLAGRVHEMTLWGFSQGEAARKRESFVDFAFTEPARLRGVRDATATRASYAERIARGGFPAVGRRETAAARQRWFTDYAARIIDRDLADLVAIRQPGVFRQTVSACAARTAQVTNLSALANDLAVGRDAVRNYVELLERVFIVTRLPAFTTNASARTSRHPKLHLTDSGLAAALVGLDAPSLVRSPEIGPLLETFVVAEIKKQLGWQEVVVTMSHFRDRDGHEVDIVLESPAGDVVGIVVKAANTVGPTDTRGLRYLADVVGADRFRHGIVLYTGANAFRIDDDPRFTACPVSGLWLAK